MLPEEIREYLKGKRCLVTGGTGLIGRCVVDQLVECGATVTSVSLDNLKPNPNVKYLIADLCNFETCMWLAKDKACVFHIAGIKGSTGVTITKPASFFVPLLMMNTNILEACRIRNVEKIVYTSSVGAYPPAEVFKESESTFHDPPMDMSPGWAKRMAEHQIGLYRQQYGLTNFAVVRPANIYGPGDNFDPANAMVIPSLIRRLLDGEDPLIVWGDGTSVRDFVYSEDIAEGIIRALYYGTIYEEMDEVLSIPRQILSFVNLGSGKEVTIKKLVDEIINAYFLLTGKIVQPLFDESKPSGFPKRVMDISLAREKIGYNPQTSLKDGLSKTIEWYRNHFDENDKRKNYFNE